MERDTLVEDLLIQEVPENGVIFWNDNFVVGCATCSDPESKLPEATRFVYTVTNRYTGIAELEVPNLVAALTMAVSWDRALKEFHESTSLEEAPDSDLPDETEAPELLH